VALKVVFRPQAEADLIGLYEYIAERSGQQITGGYIDRIEEACTALTTFRSKVGAATISCPGFVPSGLNGGSRSPTEVEIVTIAYAGRNFEDDLNG
jgi:toxin ParE1/3/4